MRVLFDQGTPVPLRALLVAHDVTTLSELGWSELQNGELLRQAEEAGFEVFVTTDQNLKYQQNLPGRSLAIAVLMAASWPRLERNSASVIAKIDALSSGDYVEISIP
ncbi:MAG: hypothetical protein IT482_03490 [Gammaproteobacteria bacterium]|nr:hypothetical protein [Gammaproteobacteria bacterium]